jgi:uncharacterized protein (DUF2141 family)
MAKRRDRQKRDPSRARRTVSHARVGGAKPLPRRSAWASLAGLALASTLPGTAPASEPGPGGSKPPPSVALTVRVHGLSSDRGRVAVALFASAEAFPDQKRALAGQLARIEKGRATVRFAGVRPGIYAVAVLHDENENAKMDFNFLGMPLEGYGFSNDASAPFGPPSFKAASFSLRPRDSFISVRTRYFF